MSKKIKALVWIYIANQGDGSGAANFFVSQEKAEEYASHDNERFCDDIYSHIFEFDEKGNLLNPDVKDED